MSRKKSDWTTDPMADVDLLNVTFDGLFVKGQVPCSEPEEFWDQTEPRPLIDYITSHPNAVTCVEVKGFSMIAKGLRPGDICVVDSSAEYAIADLVLAVIDGHRWTVKEYTGRELVAHPAGHRWPVRGSNEIMIVGKVTWVMNRRP